MTVGSQNLNKTFLVESTYTSSNGSGSYGIVERGLFGSRVWSGVDSAPVAKTRISSRKITYRSFDPRTGKDGKWVTVTVRTKSARIVKTLDRNPHNYDAVIEKTRQPGLTFIQTQVWRTGPLAGQVRYFQEIYNGSMPGGLAFPVAPWDANDDVKLISKLREKFVGSDFNMGVFLAEANQSMSLVATSALRFARFASFTRKGDLRSAWNALGNGMPPPREWTKDYRSNPTNSAVARIILEGQYGWRPLLSDMSAGAQSLAHLLNIPRVKRYSCSRKNTLTESDILGWQGSNAGDHRHRVLEATTGKSLVCYISEVPHWAALTGLTDLGSAVWNRLPWSFVADWVIPIGDWLQARAFASSLQGTFVTTTFVRKNCVGYRPNVVRKTDPSTGWEFDLYLDGEDGASFTYTNIVRRVSTSLQVPMPVVKPLAKVASFEHCVNALALLATTLRGMKLSTAYTE